MIYRKEAAKEFIKIMDEIKPREFWIEFGEERDDIVWTIPIAYATHVIEHSALESAQKRIEMLEGSLADMNTQLAKRDRQVQDAQAEILKLLNGGGE